MSLCQWVVFFEAVFFLALARFYIRFTPSKYYMQKIGSSYPPGPCDRQHNLHVAEPLCAEQMEQIKQIRCEIARAARNVPWNAVCLPQAMAAKWMCRRRNISGILYFGVASGYQPEENEQSVIFTPHKSITDGMVAHAWLRVNNTIVTGAPGHQNYVIVGKFC